MKTIEKTFNSWGEWLESVKDRPAHTHSMAGSIAPAVTDFTSNTSYNQAVHFAMNGWEDGSKRVKAISDRIGEVLTSTIEQTIYNHAVTGHNLDVGAYLAGSPECFTSPEILKIDLQGTRLVKVVVSAVCEAARESTIYERRGAAIVALIQALELDGYSCELWANYDSHYRTGDVSSHLDIKLKSYGDTFDLDRIAYALVHTAHFRRLVFAYHDKVLGTTKHIWPMNPHTAADIVIRNEECVYSSDEDAAEWAKQKIAHLQDPD